MSDPADVVDVADVAGRGTGSVGLGWLVQTAQAHQQLAEQGLRRLQAHAQGLDAVVRDEIRRTFAQECGTLVQEARNAADALAGLQRAAHRRAAWGAVTAAAVGAGAALLLLGRILPSPAQLAVLRAQRSQLSAAIAQLSASGGRIDLRRCGRARRLCVRVDRRSPAYGQSGDYFIIRGY